MRCPLPMRITLSTVLLLATTISLPRRTQAQVESIDPNPTMPFDMSRDFGYGRSNSGGRFGRDPARPGQPRGVNPAETLLKDMEGTNYGRYSGRVMGAAPRGGRPENRWRYRYYRDQWWYWTKENRWAYFDGRRWRPYATK